MGFHGMRRLWLLIVSITFLLFFLNHSNHNRVWGTPAYLESVLDYSYLYPSKPPPHRKLQFGLLETVCAHPLQSPALG